MHIRTTITRKNDVDALTRILFPPNSKLLKFTNESNPDIFEILFCTKYTVVKSGIAPNLSGTLFNKLNDKSNDLHQCQSPSATSLPDPRTTHVILPNRSSAFPTSLILLS